MKNYEKPIVEVIDFETEVVMDAGVGDGVDNSTYIDYD